VGGGGLLKGTFYPPTKKGRIQLPSKIGYKATEETKKKERRGYEDETGTVAGGIIIIQKVESASRWGPPEGKIMIADGTGQ